mgnify:CR=1 FL=1
MLYVIRTDVPFVSTDIPTPTLSDLSIEQPLEEVVTYCGHREYVGFLLL